MEINSLLFLVLLFAAGLTSGLYAQEPLTGNVEDRYLGISFHVPDDWTTYNTGAGYLMASETQKGFILIMQNEFNTIEALQSAAREGIVEEESGIFLMPEGDIDPFMDHGVQAEMTGMVEWQHAKAFAVGLLTPFDTGVTILTAVDPGIFSKEYVYRVQKIAGEMTFAKPQDHPVVEQWKESLSGMRLTYMNTYSSGTSGGFSDKIEIDLCPGGSFTYSDRSTISVNSGGGSMFNHDRNRGDGNWDIIDSGGQPALQLTYYDGSNRTYQISVDGDTFYLDSRRYFRTQDAACM